LSNCGSLPAKPGVYLKAIKIILLVGVPLLLLWAATSPYGGWLPESKFRLSQDSRLPKWFTVPPGYDRKDLTVTIDLYAPILFWNNNFRAILQGTGARISTVGQENRDE